MDNSFWTEGQPIAEGLFITRWEIMGNPWVMIHHCITNVKENKMMYIDHYGGDFHHNFPRLGKLTHYCPATGANFERAMEEIKIHYKIR